MTVDGVTLSHTEVLSLNDVTSKGSQDVMGGRL